MDAEKTRILNVRTQTITISCSIINISVETLHGHLMSTRMMNNGLFIEASYSLQQLQ